VRALLQKLGTVLFFFCGYVCFADFQISTKIVEKSLEKVWGLSVVPAKNNWTQFELGALAGRIGKAANFERVRWANTSAVDRVMIISFFDRFSKTGIGEVYIYLDRRSPVQTISTRRALDEQNFSQFEVLFNGVQFSERDEGKPAREIYLADVVDLENLEDRLRLAVNDNEILNLWHRKKIPALSREWGEDGELVPTPPQQSHVDFLFRLREQNRLRRGALIQMPTGMGKTETIQFYLKRLREEGSPFRLLWLVRGVNLVDQAKDRFGKFFDHVGEKSLSWHGETITSRDEERLISSGAARHIFVSMDSLREGSPNRSLLSRWIDQPDGSPVIVVMDEAHQIGAPTYLGLYDWLWGNFSRVIEARIAITAVPFGHLKTVG
jgi:hypothetical protein